MQWENTMLKITLGLTFTKNTNENNKIIIINNNKQ